MAAAAVTAAAGPAQAASDTSAGHAAESASVKVHKLRTAIRAHRHAALLDAYAAAMRLPRHGHAERGTASIPRLRAIAARWQRRRRYYHVELVRRTPVLRGLRCIHHYEGAWNAVSATVPTYYGGLQMDRTFEATYGADVLAAMGGADANTWSPHDQLMVGMRAYRSRGYSPWPNTAAACGLT